jgi:hypothetical protein
LRMGASVAAVADVRRPQKWLKLPIDWLQLYFQGLYVKVESKGFLLMYWKLAIVLYSKSYSLSRVAIAVVVCFLAKFF